MSTNTNPTERIAIKQNDSYSVPWQLTDREDDPIDVSDADEVRFVMADAADGTLYINQPGTIEDAKAGRVSYQFSSAETGEVNLFLAEWQILFPGGQHTVPSKDYIGVDVTQGIARTLQAADLDPNNAAVAVLNAQTVDTDTALIRNAPTTPDHALRMGDIGTPAFNHGHADDDLTPATINNHYYAAPGELQAILNAAAIASNAADGERTAVHMDPSQTYNHGSQITVPKGVSLYCHHAPLVVSGDHGGIFVDTRANVFDAEVRVKTDNAVLSPSSTAIELDTSRTTAGTKYGSQTSSGATVTGRVKNEGTGAGGTGFAARAKAATGGNAIGIGTRVDLIIDGFEYGCHAEPLEGGLNGWINSGIWYLDIAHCTKSIYHSGNGPFNTRIKGVVQTSSWTTHHFHNAGTGQSCSFEGKIWDWNLTASTTMIAGPNIKIVTDQLSGLIDQTDGASGQFGVDISGAGMSFVYFSSQQGYRFTTTAAGLQVNILGGGTSLIMREDGSLDFGAVNVANKVPATAGLVRVHSGANTGGNRELAVSQGNGNWLLMASNTEVIPS